MGKTSEERDMIADVHLLCDDYSIFTDVMGEDFDACIQAACEWVTDKPRGRLFVENENDYVELVWNGEVWQRV